MKLKLLTAAMLAMAIAPMQANAATATGTINVTATVVAPSATVNVAGPLAFGTMLTGTTASPSIATATTSFDVTVSLGVPYSIAFSDPYSGGGTRTFELSEPSGKLQAYLLFSDSTKAAPYLATTAGGAIQGKTGTGSPQTYSLFAETNNKNVVIVGNFTDTLTITVTF